MPVATRSFVCLACGSTLEFVAGATATRCSTCEDARPLPIRISKDVPDDELQPVIASAAGYPGHQSWRCTACKTSLSSPTAIARTDIGGDAQRVDSVSPSFESERFRQVLVPVWFGRMQTSNTRFAINGRTGETVIEGLRGREREQSDIEPEILVRYSWWIAGALVVVFVAVVIGIWSQ